MHDLFGHMWALLVFLMKGVLISIRHLPGSLSIRAAIPVVFSVGARCNVTNPVDIAGVVAYPDWNTLEVVYRDPDSDPTNTNTNQVIVKLIRVSNTTGGVSTLATFDSENSGASSSFQTNSTTFSHNFNFTIYAYYVEIQVKRNNSGASNNPAVSIVRLIEGIE